MEAQRPTPRDAATAARLRVFRHALASYLSGGTLQVAVARRRLKAGEGDFERVDGALSRAETELSRAASLMECLSALAEGLSETRRRVSLLTCLKRAMERAAREGIPVRVEIKENGDAAPLATCDESLEEAMIELTRLAVHADADRAIWNVDAGGATLTFAGTLPLPRPDRLFELVEVPRGDALFLAAWAVEASGGRLDVTTEGGNVNVSLNFEAAA